MTAPNSLYIIAITLIVTGWGTFAHAEGDSAGGATTASTALAPDGTPVVHKSLHKKKKTTTAAASTATAPVAGDPLVPIPKPSTTTVSAPKAPDSVLTVTAKAGQPGITSLGPPVETGLPVARHTDFNVGDPAPSGMAIASTYHSSMNSSFPSMPAPSPSIGAGTSADMNSYTPSAANNNYQFTNYSKKPTTTYPWKTNIYTTMFYIGEGATAYSSTTNHASSWDAEWESSNRGSDDPDNRNGYASGSHASTVNPFYIALPFNDLVYPDKAREWLPAGWHRPNKDGKPVSACKDRWVEIKAEDGSGHVCYAQWEDVGPLRYDHAEYVFGPERPDTATRAGLDVSPAVYDYLGMKEMKHPMTRWRFVDDEAVPPGAWLKLDEEAIIYQAMHHMNQGSSSTPAIQRTSEPIDDPMDDTNKKKVGAAKG